MIKYFIGIIELMAIPLIRTGTSNLKLVTTLSLPSFISTTCGGPSIAPSAAVAGGGLVIKIIVVRIDEHQGPSERGAQFDPFDLYPLKLFPRCLTGQRLLLSLEFIYAPHDALAQDVYNLRSQCLQCIAFTRFGSVFCSLIRHVSPLPFSATRLGQTIRLALRSWLQEPGVQLE